MPDLDTSVADQAGEVAESSAEATGGGQTQAMGETASVQPLQEGNATEEQQGALSPELEAQRKELMRGFHQKTQELAAEKRALESEARKYREEAEKFARLQQTPWFQKAVETESAKLKGIGPELGAEEFQALQTDPRAFQEYLKRRDQAVEDRLVARLTPLFEETKGLKQGRELDNVSRTYGDEFKQANETGKLDKYTQRGYDLEGAFLAYKGEEAIKGNGQRVKVEAQKLLDAKRAGAVEKPGVTSVRGGQVIKTKGRNFDDVFREVFNATANGDQGLRVVRE